MELIHRHRLWQISYSEVGHMCWRIIYEWRLIDAAL
jgi:hypothetical protein